MPMARRPGCSGFLPAASRLQAFQPLVKQKRLAKNAPILCVVRDPSTSILAEDDSLAENVQRAQLLGP
jgi:ParB family transcriptional regulator, chromosome partitioning protein